MMKFTKSHEWVKVNGHIAKVGVSDWGQKELGNIVFIELPKMDDHIKAGNLCCVLESTKAAADIYSPISGKVTKINLDLKDSPNLINTKAHTEGWIFEMEMEDPKELDKLLNQEVYERFLLV